MTIRIINDTPDASVIKRCVCSNCGVTLEYTPSDTRREIVKDYTGCGDVYTSIDCPKCRYVINLR